MKAWFRRMDSVERTFLGVFVVLALLGALSAYAGYLEATR